MPGKPAEKDRMNWDVCKCCGGDIPPESQWGQEGEGESGACTGMQRSDGMCGAFASREQYDEEDDYEVV